MKSFILLGLVALASVTSRADVVVKELGVKSPEAANLVAIQPEFEASDFMTVDSIIAKVRTYFESCKKAGLFTSKTVVVLPEYLGSWFMFTGENQRFYQKKSVQSAMLGTIWKNRARFWRGFKESKSSDRLTELGFRLKTKEMAEAYQRMGSTLAREYGVTLIPGSINLPGAYFDLGKLGTRADQPLQNIAAVFRPDGSMESEIVRKAFPTAPELKFLKAAPVESLPVFDTPAGRIGVLICADVWHPEALVELSKKGVDAIVVPQLTEHGEIWNKPWGGYSPQPDAKDVDPRDHDGIAPDLTEAQAWDKYAMPGRLALSGARAGVMASMAGRAWDMNFGAQSCGVTFVDGQKVVVKAPEPGKAAVISVWF